MLKKYLTLILIAISAFFISLFGKISWESPLWLKSVSRRAQNQPKLFLGSGIGLLVVLILLIFGYCWYQSLPKPERITAQIIPPKITPLNKKLIPDPLTINFGLISNGELNNKPVAPIHLIGKEIKDGIALAPSIAGKWIWETDSQLVFIPATDWPAGENYTIRFTKDFFAPSTKMEAYQYSFSTLPFESLIKEFKFYQDPLNPKIKQAVATINFSYPVDPASLEKKISFNFQTAKNGRQTFFAKRIAFTIDYDEHKRTAYVRTKPIDLPSTERFLELTIAKGIKPLSGHPTKDPQKATILIPNAESFFKVSHLGAVIVHDQQGRPNQVLTLETTLGVTDNELKKSLHIYLLPKDYPATAVESAKHNYQWTNPGEVSANILALAKPLAVQAIPADKDFATLHSYKFNTPTPAYLFVKIDKGAQGFGDFVLAHDYSTVIKVPEYPREISFLHKGALIALGTEEKLSVLTRGMNAVKFDFARVLPDAVNHLITQTAGDFSNPYFIDPNFNQDNISEISSQIQQFDVTNPGKEQYTALDFSKYLNAKNARPIGLFLLQGREWDVSQNLPLDIHTSRLILITDLGLVVKDNQDGTHDIFVQSITNGTPVQNANVAILGKNGLPLFQKSTDSQGRANFPNLNDFINEREPVVYLARSGQDTSFIPYARADRQLNYSRFDVGGVTTNTSEDQTALTAYVFSDRGIYRPGDIAHIGLIIKKPFVQPPPTGLPLEVAIVDPRGVTVKDEKITLGEIGYVALNFQTNSTSPTGQYVVNLYIVKDNRPSSLIGSTTINVAEFLPDRLRISAHLSKEQAEGWISPADLNTKVGLWNLYGAPAANHVVSGKILLIPKAVTFNALPGYTFIDPLLNPKLPPKVFSETLTDTHTNDQGQAEFDLNLDRFDKATYELTVFVEGFEAEGGRSVTTQTTALVSPLAYLIGYKPDGDLNYIQQNAARYVRFIAINPQLKEQPLSNLNVNLINLQPVTTLVKKDDGTYQYQSIIQTIPISTRAFEIPEKGIDYILPTQQVGDFVVTVTDEKGTELSRFKYTVVGTAQLALPKNAEMNVKLNKIEYAPGEDIELQINAPYIGAGLITIERDKVYASQWFKTNTTASVQKIHIPADFQGSGYVNIAFVRDINSPEMFMSPLSYNVVPFSVTHKDHDIAVDLTVPALAKPGDDLSIAYKTDKPSKIIIFAVDEGILQVTKYSPPDPLQFFFRKYALEVNTLQILDQILPKFIADRELSAVGGDGGAIEEISKNLNPFKRQTEAPVVYWSGILDADVTSKQLTYHVPDYFNGALRTMAIAVATNAVGSANKTTEVKGDFIINPNVPTFVAPGDEFEVTAGIANNLPGSGTDTSIEVSLIAPPQLEILGSAKQTINVSEGQEKSLRFKLRAKSQLGSAELKWKVQASGKVSNMASSLSIRPVNPYFTTLVSGFSKEANKAVSLDRLLYPEYRTVIATASSSPLILTVGLQHYLDRYPYGCTEQLTSQAFPLLVMVNQPWFAKDTKAITDKIQLIIQMLSQRQMSSGGFNYWPGSGDSYSNDFASVYAAHFLTEARAQGYTLPNDLFSNTISFLKDFVAQNAKDLDHARLIAYAIYVLTRNEIVTTNYLTNLQLTLEQNPKWDWHNDITSAYIAATYQLLKSSGDANRIINYYKPDFSPSATTDFYNQSIANAQYLFLICRHFPDRWQNIDTRIIMSLVDALNTNTISTVLSAYTSLALSAYGQSGFEANGAISISESLQDGKQIPISTGNDPYQKVNVSEDARQIIFYNPNRESYFYQLIQSGFDKELPKKAIKDGIEVYREYRNLDDRVITNTYLGKEIIVDIRIRSIDDQYYDNVAVIDLLPGGFEVVRDSIKLQNMDYADAREDRVIFFGGIGPDAKEIIYRIKATNTGQFNVPPILAMSMYNPLVKSLGLGGQFSIEKNE